MNLRTRMLNNKNKYEFECCEWIWFLYLRELNWRPEASNPLDIIHQSLCSETTESLIKARYILQTQDFYLKESDKYIDYLGKGGKPFSKRLVP